MTSITLFAPARVGALDLKNRIAMAPMTRSRGTDDRVPKPVVAQYYAQRSGAGLIVSEGVGISPGSFGFPNVPGIYSDAQVQGWRNVTERLRGSGTRFFMQLWHVGRVSHPDNLPPGMQPCAPSALAAGRDVVTRNGPRPAPVPHALESDEVWAVVRDYAQAARRAIEAGCDGVEIHAANGYLPAQFLHETTNLRTDEWGGSIEKRARFIVEVTRACAQAVGPDRVGVRLSPFSAFNGASSSNEPAAYEYLLAQLAPLGLAYLHVVTMEVVGHMTREADAAGVPDVVGFARQRWPGVLIAAGGYDRAKAEQDLNAGRADIIAFGRDFVGNPDLPERLAHGWPLVERRMADWYGPDAKGYTDYPDYAAASATDAVTEVAQESK